MTQIKEALNGPTQEELKADLHNAVYGEATHNENSLGEKRLFKAKPTTSRQHMCDGSTATSQATTVASWLMCLCTMQTSNGVGKACGRGVTTSASWYTLGSHEQRAWQGVAKLCPKQYTGDFTASSLTSLIAAITAKLRSLTSKTIYGTLEGSNCNGENTGGLCVSFSDVHSSGGKNLNGFCWIATLRTLASKLRDREDARQQKKLLYSMIQAAAAQTYEIATTLQSTPKAQVTTTPLAASPTNVAKKQIDCSVHSNKTACKNAGKCKWKGGDSEDKEECEVDESKVVSQKNAAATGDGATATPSGCARHGTDKTACENDKTSDKQNCAFRKGKDGEDDKGMEKCRDGSFLVNNKLALIVSVFIVLRFQVFLFNFMKFFVLREFAEIL
uniref:Variant surface glycoprotein 1125.3112 n=1 Tax=Trypanosoma brucei TaxID=5691 RepID=A0A1J0R9D8_9TRYP|nr:variant surface glycoprotein 1125.3112 [Trypanosoma brucei]